MSTKSLALLTLGSLSVVTGFGLGLALLRGIFLGATRGFGAARSQGPWIVFGYLLFFALAVYLFNVGRRAMSTAKGQPQSRVRFGWGRMLVGTILLYSWAIGRFHLIPRSFRHLEPANKTEAVAMEATAIVIVLCCFL